MGEGSKEARGMEIQMIILLLGEAKPFLDIGEKINSNTEKDSSKYRRAYFKI